MRLLKVCLVDSRFCFFHSLTISRNIKSRRKTNQSASYVELLQSELKMMTAGVQKMYSDLQKQGIWPDTHASDTYRHSSTESILEALGIVQDKSSQGARFDPIENNVRIPHSDQIHPTNQCNSAMSRKAAEEPFGYIDPVLSQAFADAGMPHLWNPSWEFASCMLDDANLIGDFTLFGDDTV